MGFRPTQTVQYHRGGEISGCDKAIAKCPPPCGYCELAESGVSWLPERGPALCLHCAEALARLSRMLIASTMSVCARSTIASIDGDLSYIVIARARISCRVGRCGRCRLASTSPLRICTVAS